MNATDRERLFRDPDTLRCLRAMTGDEHATLDDLRCCYSSTSDPDASEDAAFLAYAEQAGLPLVEIDSDELASLRADAAKLEFVEGVSRMMSEREAKAFADSEAREQAACDRDWPVWRDALGLA